MRTYLIKSTVVVSLALLLGATLWQVREFSRDEGVAVEPFDDGISRHVRYGFTLRNTTGQLLEEAEFWTYAPVRQTSTQRCCERLQTNLPHTLEVDNAGNQVMHFKVPALAPHASVVLQINAGLRLAPAGKSVSANGVERYLSGERYVEVDDPRIRALAARMHDDGPGVIANQAFDLVRGSLRYAGYVRKDLGALHALEKGEGDCTEYMYLFMALARARGLPARGIGGYVYDRDAVLRSSDYHNWAEFYAGGKWEIADAQKGILKPEQPAYIAMQILGQPAEGAVSSSHRYWHSGNGLEVRMN